MKEKQSASKYLTYSYYEPIQVNPTVTHNDE